MCSIACCRVVWSSGGLVRKQFTTALPVTQVSTSSVLSVHSLAVLSSHRLRQLLPTFPCLGFFSLGRLVVKSAACIVRG